LYFFKKKVQKGCKKLRNLVFLPLLCDTQDNWLDLHIGLTTIEKREDYKSYKTTRQKRHYVKR